MAMGVKDNWKGEMIQQIKDCGQSLIDNAENIVNDYKYLKGEFIITCYIGREGDLPRINVDTDFYPEKFIERYS